MFWPASSTSYSLHIEMVEPNQYELLSNFHPSLSGDHNYWRLSSLWPQDILLERAEKNRSLAMSSDDKAYLQFMYQWLMKQGFTPLPQSSDELTEQALHDALTAVNSGPIGPIKIDVRLKKPPTKTKTKSKRAKKTIVTNKSILMITKQEHKQCLALMGCTQPQITGEILLSDCMRAVVKYVWNNNLQDPVDKQLIHLDQRLRTLFNLPPSETKCSYYDYKEHLLKALALKDDHRE